MKAAHVRAGGLLLAAVCAATASCARYVYYPDDRIVMTPADAGIRFDDVTLIASDGVAINAWYIGAPHARGTVLFCHGNGGNMSYNVDRAAALRDLGLNVLMFDYRGYGRSKGRPSEKGTYLDALAAWEYLANSRNAEPRSIVIHGQSLGGGVASRLAAQRTPGALILESTFTTVPDVAVSATGTSIARSLVSGARYDSLANCRAITCPTLVIHSRQDEMIPFDMGVRLYDALPEGRKYFLEITGSHNAGWIGSIERYKAGMRAFLDEALSGTRPQG